MSELKTFLKVLEKVGYPNEKIDTISKMVSYDLSNLLSDLKEDIGEDGVLDFCKRSLEKITGNKPLRVELGDYEFIYVYLHPKFYNEDDSKNDIVCGYAWGDSKILGSNPETGEEEYKTIGEIIDETDMGSWSELDELIDYIKEKTSYTVSRSCGFGIWFE